MMTAHIIASWLFMPVPSRPRKPVYICYRGCDHVIIYLVVNVHGEEPLKTEIPPLLWPVSDCYDVLSWD
jgi:hypothetical protein